MALIAVRLRSAARDTALDHADLAALAGANPRVVARYC